MHTNELTFNELSAGDFIPNDWGHIDISGYATARNDKEVCFKLSVWSLQCKFATLLGTYFTNLEYGIISPCSLDDLKKFKYGLEILNRYNPRDIIGDTTKYNTLTYSQILQILQTLYKKY